MNLHSWHHFGGVIKVKFAYLKYSILLICFNLQYAYCKGNELAQKIDNLVLHFGNSIAQNDPYLLNNVVGENLEFTVNDTHSNYSKKQALIILDDFFNQNKPKNFKLDFKGISPNKLDYYIIGTIITKNDHFKVYMYLKNVQGEYFIQELKISQD